MPTVGIIVGSLSSKSINRELAKAIAKRLPEDVESTFIEIADREPKMIDICKYHGITKTVQRCANGAFISVSI